MIDYIVVNEGLSERILEFKVDVRVDSNHLLLRRFIENKEEGEDDLEVETVEIKCLNGTKKQSRNTKRILKFGVRKKIRKRGEGYIKKMEKDKGFRAWIKKKRVRKRKDIKSDGTEVARGRRER